MGQGEFRRIPRHIGVIPDGNRRWAESNGMDKKDGYRYGVDAGFEMYQLCRGLGVEELTLYGFTRDNTKRPVRQREEFRRACVEAVMRLAGEDAALRVIGDDSSEMFPRELVQFTERREFGAANIKVNFLVNYDWAWDLSHAWRSREGPSAARPGILRGIASADVSRIDLIIRWGGRRRLSGF
ncbi:MAG: undecaprenyl diphosphate synthase family protein, partial [Bacillota bacterium]